MDQGIIRQLDEAVAEVFAVMLNLDCASEPVEHMIEAAPESAAEIAAAVHISAPLLGCCRLEIDLPAAAEITASLLGMPPEEVPTEVCTDTAGELCNMIAGCWKKRYSADRAASKLSCPTVGRGACRHPADAFHHKTTRLYRFRDRHLTIRLACN